MPTDRTPPAGYGPPDAASTDNTTSYYLAEQPDWDGATALFLVMKRYPGQQHILAEKCDAVAGREIVDALRRTITKE